MTVAASACLTGAEVRYDGSGAKSSYPHDRLKGLLQIHPVCPEVGVGMPTPRPPIRLVGDSQSPRVVSVHDPELDHTAELSEFGRHQAKLLRDVGVSGYVFMKNSPSCGLFRVKVYPNGAQMPVRAGRGIYADAVARAWPELPLEECGRLQDAILRENFVMRVFAYAHWQALVAEGITAGRLVAYHSRYKYLLMAHSVPAYKATGRLLADLKTDLEPLAQRYIEMLMQGLSRPASRGGHANVLSHLQGYFKDHLNATAKRDLADLIDGYRRGEQPLLAVLAVLRHHLSQHPDEYVAYQVYLEPTPASAGLRVAL